ncbi:MAG: hypothetical protein HC768_21205 [Acaryochloris sp. CRU_2_0]|nr:hypothetical protein [Acaryochloris sp. CRU_2_0]
MRRYFTVIIAIFVNSMILISDPAYANTEACLNKVLQSKDLARYGFDEANQVAEVEHDGVAYHWIQLFYPGRKSQNTGVTSVLATNNQGLCKMVFVDIPEPLPRMEDYYSVLGREVTDKFIQAFQSDR